MAILSHLAVVIGMVLIGYRHFDNIRAGIAAATLYLLLPYTAQLTGRVDHVLPRAVGLGRGRLSPAVDRWNADGVGDGRDLLSGVFVAVVAGLLLAAGVAAVFAGSRDTLAALVARWSLFRQIWLRSGRRCKQMFGWTSLSIAGPQGFWNFDMHRPGLSLPGAGRVFGVLRQLGAVAGSEEPGHADELFGGGDDRATQFWHPRGGGLYMAWYLPLVLLTIFRPNLEDRVALLVLGEGWFPKRRAHLAPTEQAA